MSAGILHCEVTMFYFVLVSFMGRVLQAYANPFLLFCSLNQAYIFEYHVQQLFFGVCLMVILYFPLFITCINWNSIVRKHCVCSSIYFFISLFKWIWIHGFLFYSMVEKSNTIMIYFVAQIVLALAIGNSLGWHLCSSEKVLFFFEHFLNLWYHELFQAHLVLFFASALKSITSHLGNLLNSHAQVPVQTN